MELCNTKITDIDMERGTLLIRHGKGDRDRMLPIGDRAIAWVRKYLGEVRPELVIGMSDNYLFLGTAGEGLRNYLAQADKKGPCHIFRHTMATLMLEHGADIRYIQAMLGHVNLNTTQIYTQVSINKLKEIHTATHPAKNKPSDKLETIHERITVNHKQQFGQKEL